jgi:hypothetical protein
MDSATKIPLFLSPMITRKISKTILFFLMIFSVPVLRWNVPEIHAQEQSRPGVGTTVEAARAAGVPDASLKRILTLSVDYHISPDDLNCLLQLLRAARTEGVPVEPLVAKVEEGLAKRVTVAVIAIALEQKIEDYNYVRSLIAGIMPVDSNEPVSEAYLTIMADSLSGGLTKNDLAHFVKNAPPAPPSMLAIAAENLALLKQIGFEEKLSDQILYTGLRLRCFDSSWRYLAGVVAVARNRGIPDVEITEKTVRAMKNKNDLRDLMAALGFTDRDLRRGPAIGKGGRAGG